MSLNLSAIKATKSERPAIKRGGRSANLSPELKALFSEVAKTHGKVDLTVTIPINNDNDKAEWAKVYAKMRTHFDNLGLAVTTRTVDDGVMVWAIDKPKTNDTNGSTSTTSTTSK